MSTTTTLPAPGSHFISIGQAVDMTSLYRVNRETILDTPYKDQGILALSETFNRDVFDELLSESGCAGLRIYYGMDEDLRVHAIIIAVNESNEDILPSGNELNENDNSIGEEGHRCPNVCPPPSPLNS